MCSRCLIHVVRRGTGAVWARAAYCARANCPNGAIPRFRHRGLSCSRQRETKRKKERVPFGSHAYSRRHCSPRLPIRCSRVPSSYEFVVLVTEKSAKLLSRTCFARLVRRAKRSDAENTGLRNARRVSRPRFTQRNRRIDHVPPRLNVAPNHPRFPGRAPLEKRRPPR